jgi:hypothetical protein
MACRRRGATGTAVSYFIALTNFWSPHGTCRPTQQQIADFIGRSVRTVQRAKPKLLGVGAIEASQPPPLADGRRRPIVYTLVDLDMPWIDRGPDVLIDPWDLDEWDGDEPLVQLGPVVHLPPVDLTRHPDDVGVRAWVFDAPRELRSERLVDAAFGCFSGVSQATNCRPLVPESGSGSVTLTLTRTPETGPDPRPELGPEAIEARKALLRAQVAAVRAEEEARRARCR